MTEPFEDSGFDGFVREHNWKVRFDKLAAMSPKRWTGFIRDVILYNYFEECCRVSPIPLSNLPIAAWLRDHDAKLQELFAQATSADGKVVETRKKKGKTRSGHHVPAARTFRRMVAKVRAAGGDIAELYTEVGDQGGRRLHPDLVTLIDKLLPLYIKESRCSLNGFREFIRAQLQLDNLKRAADDQLPLPHRDGILRIKRTPAGVITAAQWGQKNARQIHKIVTEGPKLYRFGELLAFDTWSVQLGTLFEDLKLWAYVPENFEKKSNILRIRVCFLRCCATGYVLGIAGGLEEDGVLVRGTYAMAFEDRTPIARLAGAEGDWSLRIQGEGLLHDGGSGHTGLLSARAGLLLFRNVTSAAGNFPNLRGDVERGHLMIEQRINQAFTGRTFKGPETKGDYDFELRTSLTAGEAMRGVIRGWVDELQYLPSAGLHNQSPYHAAQEAIANSSSPPIFSTDNLRVARGIQLTIRLNREGLRFLHIKYRCQTLSDILFDNGPTDLTVAVDLLNVGRVSFYWRKLWHTAAAAPELDGLRAGEWLAGYQAIYKRNGAQAAVEYPIVARAVRDRMAMAGAAERRAGLEEFCRTPEAIERLREDCKMRLVYDDDPDSHSGPLRARSIGKTYSRLQAPKALPLPSSAPTGPSPPDESPPPARWRASRPRAS